LGITIKHSKTYFILGLLIGLGFGLIFSIYSGNKEKIDNLSSVIFNYSDSTFNKKTKIAKPIITKNKVKKKKKKKHNQIVNKISKDSIQKDSLSLKTDSILYNDTILDSNLTYQIDSSFTDTLSYNKIDSTYLDDSIYNKYNDSLSFQDNDMMIAQDELIYSEYIIPQGKKSDFLCKTFGELDSVLTNNIVTHKQEGIYVEFWRSPLNSTGYKLSHNALVLYGFYQYKDINLKYLKNGRLKLSYLNNTFEITCSDEFIPLQITK